jgi:hypothetical protein
MSQFSDNVFRGGPNFNSDLDFQKGFAPFVKKAGFLGTKSYLNDPITPRMNTITEKMGMHASKLGGKAMEFMDAEQRKWTDANMEDVRAAFVTDAVENSDLLRGEAIKELGKMGKSDRVSSTAEAKANFDRRIQGFRRARNKLKESAEAGKRLGSDVNFNTTGAELLDPDIDKFYDLFDAKVAERRNAYAEQYGNGSSYEQLGMGYSNMEGSVDPNADSKLEFLRERGYEGDMPSSLLYGLQAAAAQGYDLTNEVQRNRYLNENPEYRESRQAFLDLNDAIGGQAGFDEYEALGNRAGRDDIDALVLNDIIGGGSDLYAFMDSTGMKDLNNFNEEMMSRVRDGFAQTFSGAYEGANERSGMENQNRTDLANTMEREARATQQIGRKKREESIAEQVSSIRDSERIAESTLKKQQASLTEVGTRKKKVRGVDLADGRPE